MQHFATLRATPRLLKSSSNIYCALGESTRPLIAYKLSSPARISKDALGHSFGYEILFGGSEGRVSLMCLRSRLGRADDASGQLIGLENFSRGSSCKRRGCLLADENTESTGDWSRYDLRLRSLLAGIDRLDSVSAA